MADIKQFPTEVVDRTAKLAGAIAKLLELSDADDPATHLTALILVQAAIQQAVLSEEGPAALNEVLREAVQRRRRYDLRWKYRVNKGDGTHEPR